MKKTISIICILTTLNYIGCSSTEIISKNTFIRTYSLSNGDNSNDIYVNTVDENQYFFQSGSYSISNDSLKGIGKKILPNEMQSFNGKIALKDIESFEGKTTDKGNTLLLVLGIVTIGAVLVIVTSIASANSSMKSCSESLSNNT